MCQPPDEVKNDSKRMKYWKPPVKTDIDWETVHTARGDKVGTAVGGATAPLEGEDDKEPQILTIGLIGKSYPPTPFN